MLIGVVHIVFTVGAGGADDGGAYCGGSSGGDDVSGAADGVIIVYSGVATGALSPIT